MKSKQLIPVRDLFGDGSAFFILGRARRGALRAGWTEKQWSAFQKKATAGDYDHLLQTVTERFEEEDDEGEEE